MFDKWFKAKKPPCILPGIDKKEVYEFALLSLKQLLSVDYYRQETQTAKGKAEAVDFLIDMVRKDLVSSWNASTLIYGNDDLFRHITPYPYAGYDDGECEVSLQTDMLSITWRASSIVAASFWLKRQDFKYYPSNHKVHYYDGLNLCIVHNGLHSLAYSKYLKKHGTFIARHINVKRMFCEVYTDGEYWYDYRTNARLKDKMCGDTQDCAKIDDTRFAILFIFCQVKYFLENGIEFDANTLRMKR